MTDFRVCGHSHAHVGTNLSYTFGHVWRDERMTEEELLKLARENLGETDIDSVRDAVLAFHGHGSADEVTGDVESPTGHVIRVDRFIVLTNELGQTTLVSFESEDHARGAFATHSDAYSHWSRESEVD